MSGNNKVAKKSSKKKKDHDNDIIDLKRQVREEIAKGDKAGLIAYIRTEMFIQENMKAMSLCYH
jgi:hypothetical protein